MMSEKKKMIILMSVYTFAVWILILRVMWL